MIQPRIQTFFNSWQFVGFGACVDAKTKSIFRERNTFFEIITPNNAMDHFDFTLLYGLFYWFEKLLDPVYSRLGEKNINSSFLSTFYVYLKITIQNAA